MLGFFGLEGSTCVPVVLVVSVVCEDIVTVVMAEGVDIGIVVGCSVEVVLVEGSVKNK